VDETDAPTLVLGGTGKTGGRVARRLTGLGLRVRTAARHGADVRFDWDDETTHRNAIVGVKSFEADPLAAARRRIQELEA
jgi:uncharacterized protein YbjT (DUF2867 family)